MKFSKIKEMWAGECEVDFTKIDEVTRDTPKLHTKYLTHLTTERYKLREFYEEQNIQRKDKIEYYMGRADDAVYKAKPFDLKILKSEVQDYLKADPEVIALNLKVAAMEEKVAYLEDIIKILMNRRWEVKNYIDWAKFKSGVGG